MACGVCESGAIPPADTEPVDTVCVVVEVDVAEGVEDGTELSTVTPIVDVAKLPAVSLVTAYKVYAPSVRVVVSKDTEYADVVSSDPIFVIVAPLPYAN